MKYNEATEKQRKELDGNLQKILCHVELMDISDSFYSENPDLFISKSGNLSVQPYSLISVIEKAFFYNNLK